MASASLRTCLAFSLLTLAILLATARGGGSDDLAHLGTAEGWLLRRSAALPNDHYKAALITSRGSDGRLYSNLDPGMPFFLLPFVAVGELASRLGTGAPLPDLASAYGMEQHPDLPAPVIAKMRATNSDPRVLAAALAIPFAGALATLLLLLALREAGFDRRVVIAAAAGLGLGWPLVVYAGTLWTQVPALACLAAALYWTVRVERTGKSWPAFLAGAAAGASVLVRFELCLVVPVLAVATTVAALGQGAIRRALVAFGAGVGLAALGWAAWSLATRGVLRPPRRGAFGALPWWEGVLLLIASPAKGLLLFAPWLLLVPWGARALWARSRALAIGTIGIFAVQLGTFATWFDWGSAWAYGPRFLAPAAALLVLPVAAALHDGRRVKVALFAGLLGLGLVVSLPGALQFPRVHDVNRDNAWTRLAPFEAWRALLTTEDIRSEYLVLEPGVDCLSTREPLVAVLAGTAGLAGAWMLRRRADARELA